MLVCDLQVGAPMCVALVDASVAELGPLEVAPGCVVG